MVLAPLSAGFQPLPPPPTIKLGPSGTPSRVGGLVHALGPCGSLNKLSCEAGSFSCCCLNPQGVFSQRFEALFPHTGTLGCEVCLLVHQLLPRLVSCSFACPTPQSATLLGPPAAALQRVLSTQLPSPPLLRVWMDVSSLSPWLLDFHTVRFSVSSGCFLFINCCCPSLGCARRHGMSTYASILAGSPLFQIFREYTFSRRYSRHLDRHECSRSNRPGMECHLPKILGA